jgi:hypothetical protein
VRSFGTVQEQRRQLLDWTLLEVWNEGDVACRMQRFQDGFSVLPSKYVVVWFNSRRKASNES